MLFSRLTEAQNLPFWRFRSGLLAILTSLAVPALSAAQETPKTLPEPSFVESLAQLGPMFLMVFAIYYLLVLRPKAQEERAHESLLKELKKGDTVLTIGGLIGKVTSNRDGVVQLEIGKNMTVRVSAEYVKQRFSETPAKKAA